MSRFENYLRSNLTRYTYEAKAKADIIQALKEYTDLRPKLEKFTFNNGETRDLMAMNGTLPVKYLRNTYNIPVAVFLLETYPYNPPLVFVRPTSTMQIKPNKHVDSNGKVYLPYLTEWKHPDSDLTSLFSILQIVFQEQPPVFSKPAGGAPIPPVRPQQPPPYPATGGGYSAPTQPYPYPSGGAGYPSMPMPHGHPPPPNATPPGGPGGYIGSGWTSGGGGGNPAGGGGGYMGSYPGYTMPSQQGYPTSQAASQGSGLSEAEVNASLRSAVEDKLKRRLREVYAQHKAELDKLENTQDELTKRRNSLEQMISRAEKEEEELKKALSIIGEKNKEIEEYLRRHEQEDRLNVDEAVDTTVPLYRQLFNAFAEEQAIEDAIYYLAEAHRKGVIDLETFLKKVRDLSREQFMLRVTVQKCREKAGLPEL